MYCSHEPVQCLVIGDTPIYVEVEPTQYTTVILIPRLEIIALVEAN